MGKKEGKGDRNSKIGKNNCTPEGNLTKDRRKENKNRREYKTEQVVKRARERYKQQNRNPFNILERIHQEQLNNRQWNECNKTREEYIITEYKDKTEHWMSEPKKEYEIQNARSPNAEKIHQNNKTPTYKKMPQSMGKIQTGTGSGMRA